MNTTATQRPDMSTAVLAPLVVADRCDACGAQAFMRVLLRSGYELLFCGHHGRENTPALVAAGASLRDDTALINVKPSVSANAD